MEHGDQDPRRFVAGEDSGTDMRKPLARQANKLLRLFGGKDSNTVINLGEEHGDVSINHVRFRDALQEGHLVAYIRQEASDPKVIVPSVIALGVVVAGIYKLRHSKK